MGGNLILGAAMLVICVAIQCYVVSLLAHFLVKLVSRKMLQPTLGAVTLLLSVVMLVMVSGNLCQAALWAGLFMLLGEFQDFSTAFYHSAVNFTTLGYGDIVMSEKHRLLGAIEAANGVLMLGLTTSVMFLALNMAVKKIRNGRSHSN